MIPVIGENVDESVDHIEEFVTGRSERALRDREHVAVLFTDIVDSTVHLVEAGDKLWRDILDTHDRLAHRRVRAHHGRVVKSTGDGVLAAFPSAEDALAAARALAEALSGLSLRIRAAIHVGEVELRRRRRHRWPQRPRRGAAAGDGRHGRHRALRTCGRSHRRRHHLCRRRGAERRARALGGSHRQHRVTPDRWFRQGGCSG